MTRPILNVSWEFQDQVLMNLRLGDHTENGSVLHLTLSKSLAVDRGIDGAGSVGGSEGVHCIG